MFIIDLNKSIPQNETISQTKRRIKMSIQKKKIYRVHVYVCIVCVCKDCLCMFADDEQTLTVVRWQPRNSLCSFGATAITALSATGYE